MKRLLALLTCFGMLIATSPAHGNELAELVEMEHPTSGGWIGVDFIETDYFGTSLLEAGNAK